MSLTSFARAGLALAVALSALALPVGPSYAQGSAPAARELSTGQIAGRERQKKCGAEWRALSVGDKAAKGPKWPQYFSKCVKRLKEQRA